MAGRRSRTGEEGRVGDSGPGQRQAALACDCRVRHFRRRLAHHRFGRCQGAKLHRRSSNREGGRGAAAVGECGGKIGVSYEYNGGQLITDELKEIFGAAREERLKEILGDPDDYLELRTEVRERLHRQQQELAEGERGEDLNEITPRLLLACSYRSG